MTCSIIAAISNNNVIGNKGRIPWDLPEDRLHFKNLTMNHAVIFGRKTFEEIGKALPGRINIVVSTTKKFKAENLYTATNLEEALELAKKLSPDYKNDEFFICGGQKLYQAALSFADKIYLTKINADISGDTFFPTFNEKDFKLIQKSELYHQNGFEYFFAEYKK